VLTRIRAALLFLVNQGESKKYTSLQFAFALQASGPGQTKWVPGGRFFFESTEVRKLEKTPQLLVNTPLEQLATLKQLNSPAAS
jgi:hypothetical protein